MLVGRGMIKLSTCLEHLSCYQMFTYFLPIHVTLDTEGRVS
jgi:hypothetical protein